MSEESESSWIRRIAIRNLRNIKAETVDLAPFTLIIGPNGSGKSSLINSLRFVAESLRFGLAMAVERQGGLRSLFRLYYSRNAMVSAPLGLELQLGALPDSRFRDATYEYDLTTDHPPIVKREALRVRTKAVKSRSGLRLPHTRSFQAHNGRVEQNGFEVSLGTNQDLRVWERQLLLPFFAHHPLVRPIYEFLAQIEIAAPDPDSIRGGWSRSAEVPDPAGAELSSLLARLHLQSHESYKQIMDCLLEAIPFVADASRRNARTGLFEIKESDSKLKLPLPYLSDGSLRALAQISALFRSDQPRLVVIDEVENALHPGAVEAIIKLVREHAVPSGAQVVITTHNPYLLDLALDPHRENPARVIVARRDERGGATFTPASEGFYDLVKEHGARAGEYWVHGGFRDFPDMLEPEEEIDGEGT